MSARPSPSPWRRPRPRRPSARALPISATGAISITATYSAALNTKADAKAGGDDVAVGAAVSVVVFEPTTRASTERNLAGDSVAIAAASTISSIIESNAGAGGNDSGSSDADSTANDEVQGNTGQSPTLPSAGDETTNASETSSSESGQGGSGVGVAAAVSVNVVIARNTASVANGLTIAGSSGSVSVTATNSSDATAKATGTSLKSDADANIGAAVGVNFADVDNLATVGSDVTMSAGAGDITITALTAAGQTNDFVVWGFAAAGGTSSDVSVAGSVGVNIVLLTNNATTGGSGSYTASGSMTLGATAPTTVQNLAISGALGDTAVGAAVAVTVVTIDTRATLGAGEDVSAGGMRRRQRGHDAWAACSSTSPTCSTSSARSSSVPSPSAAR